MTIELRDVGIRVRGKTRTITLQDINIRVDRKQRVALLCPEGLAGLVNVISGVVPPHSGKVSRKLCLSWPLPEGSFCHKHLSLAGNARFMARLYERDESSLISSVQKISALADWMDKKLGLCPKPVVARFLFALGASLDFEMYLFTNTSIGDKTDSDRYAQMIAEIGKERGLIVATTKFKAAEPFCDRAFLIDGRTTHYYEDMEAASEHMARLAKRSRPEDGEDEDAAPEEDDRSFDDF